MLSENREFHYNGELTLFRSHVLDKKVKPKDDQVNWLFLKIGIWQFSFVYKIMDPLSAEYELPFKIELAFTMIEKAIETLKLETRYEVLRGQEPIGSVILINLID
jgi:hypothetical protein